MSGMKSDSGCKEAKDISILLADDFIPNQKLISAMLKKAGIVVELASDGLQAVDAFESKSYDLILMDIEMPQMDGYKATTTIRNMEAGKHVISGRSARPSGSSRIPIVAMTGYPVVEVGKACMEAGMDECISKPVKLVALYGALRRWIHFCPDSMPIDHVPQSGKLKTIEEGAPMDFNRALLEFDGDEDFLLKILRGFIGSVNSRIQVMRRALRPGMHWNCKGKPMP